jgi:hypothetical protein
MMITVSSSQIRSVPIMYCVACDVIRCSLCSLLSIPVAPVSFTCVTVGNLLLEMFAMRLVASLILADLIPLPNLASAIIAIGLSPECVGVNQCPLTIVSTQLR